jgi:putative ABC transport system permease protein
VQTTTLESVSQDVRLACRGLWRAKPFAVASVLTLALGIAGVTVMFALIQGVLLRPLPVRDQDRLILAWKEVRTSGSARYPFGRPEIDAVAAESQLLERAGGVTRNGVGRIVIADNGVSSHANGALVTGAFFEVLGVRPVLGRTLTPSDDKDGAENVIVLSHRLWQRRFGESREVIGRRVTVDDRPFTIIGVMPPDLDYPAGVEVWAATSSVPASGPFGDAARYEVNLIARLREGVTVAQATSEIVGISRRLEADGPPTRVHGFIPIVRPFVDVVVGDVRTPLLLLFGAVGLVLLIASANVANLLVMRGEARRGEFAVRAALGAGRSRIVRYVVAESLVIAALAGIIACVFAWWSVPVLLALVPEGLPRVESIRIDPLVIAFAIAVVFATAFAAALAPALSSMLADVGNELRSGGRGVTGTAAARGRRALVVAQVAFAVTVVAVSGLLIRSVLRLQTIDLGMPADRLVLLDLHLPAGRYEDRRAHGQFLDAAITELESLPAVSAVTPVNISPFSGQGWDVPRFTAEGQGDNEVFANPSLNLESIHPNYFDTFEVPVVRGRAFDTGDREGALPVAIVSEDVASQIWAGQNPIGKRLKFGAPASQNSWFTVVGIAANTRYRALRSPFPTLYLPAAQFQMTATMLVVRTTASLDVIASSTRDRIRAIDPQVRIMRVAPFSEMLARPLARPRFHAFLLSVFAVAALLLSTVGLYAVMAAYVRQRDREIALRLALGATAARVRHFVLAETARLAGLGALIGLAVATAGTRFLRGMLFEVDPLDPSTLLGAALLLMAASALASYLPVRRATRVDASVMLRGQ